MLLAPFVTAQGTVTVYNYGAVGDGVTDDTAAFNKAIASGFDVLVPAGSFLITAPMLFSKSRQKIRCEYNGKIYPNYDGDVFRVTGEMCELSVYILGDHQPKMSVTGGAIVIGYGGAVAWKTSVSGSRIDGYGGNAFVWEQGAGADFKRTWARNCGGVGYLCTANYNDNNHGYFADTEATSCGGNGYSILGVVGAYDNPLNSRHHVFLDAKGYGNAKNFSIQTLSNWGSVFSEAGIAPDEFSLWSTGNKIEVIETRVARVAWVDLGQNNQLGGFDSYEQYSWRNHIANNYQVNNMFEGRWNKTQTADRTFEDNISATTGVVTVTRTKGTASKRTDAFGDRIKFPPGALAIPLIVSQSTMGTQTVATNGLANGSSVNFSIDPSVYGIGNGDTVLLTPFNSSAAANYGISIGYYICFTGAVLAKITNSTGAALTADTNVRIVVLKHVA